MLRGKQREDNPATELQLTDGDGISGFTDYQWPQPKDNASIVIFVKELTFGARSRTDDTRTNFDGILGRLRSMGCISISENPQRLLRPRFVTRPQRCRPAWGELQCHRKILGFIGIAFASREPTVSEQRWIASFKEARFPFETSVLDSRLVLLDHSPSSLHTFAEHCLCYRALAGYAGLENDIRDFVRSLFWVLESRRLGVAYLKMENPPLPKVPGEEKHAMLPDVSKRTLKKRCLGRWKKQIGDYTLMTGLASLAMQEYNGAIELLKPVGDSLWLAAALEGYACAAVLDVLGHTSTSSPLVRAKTFCEGDFRRITNVPWSLQCQSAIRLDFRNDICSQQILDTFVQALGNYKKVPFATKLELECAFKAAHLLVELKNPCLLNQFFNIECCKFLDDDFKQISDEEKARICWWMARFYLRAGFWRKYAFYCRLAALFLISYNESEPNNMETYRTVYPLLLKSLDSYTKNVSSSTEAGTYYGWPGVEVNILHEVHVAALRAGYKEASIRHLLFLLQHLYASLGQLNLHQYSSEIELLCTHSPIDVWKPLRISPAVLLPSIPITNLPRVISIRFKPLSDDQEIDTSSKKKTSSVFIYTPFGTGALDEERLIARRVTAVEVTLANPTSIALQMSNFSLCCEGIPFSIEPREVIVPARGTLVCQFRGMAHEAGCFKIIGRMACERTRLFEWGPSSAYSFQIFGVTSICRLESIPWYKALGGHPTRVLPHIPLLDIEFVDEKESARGIQRTLYAGQTVRIEVKLKNPSESEPIRDIQATIERTTFQGPVTSVAVQVEPTAAIEQLKPKESVDLCITVTCHDRLDSAGRIASKTSLKGPESAETSALWKPTVHSTILQVRYTVNSRGVEQKEFRRRAARPIKLSIRPALIVQGWTILLGESWLSRHLAIDLHNAAEDDVILYITAEKNLVIPSKDSCRVPIIVSCYQWPRGNERPPQLASEAPFERSELCKAIQEWVIKQISLRWSIERELQTGRVPLLRLLDQPTLYREFCVPPFSLELSVEDSQGMHLNYNDLSCVARSPLRIAFRFTLLDDYSIEVRLTLRFFLDLQNGLTKDKDEEAIFTGPEAYVIVLCSTCKIADAEFDFMFCREGSFQALVNCDCTYVPLVGKAFQYSPLVLPVLNFQVSSEQ